MYRLYSIILCIVILCSGCSLWTRIKKAIKSNDTIQEEVLNEAEAGTIAEALSELDADREKESSTYLNKISDKKTNIDPESVEKNTQHVKSVDPSPSLDETIPKKKVQIDNNNNNNNNKLSQSQEQKMYKDALHLYELHKYNESITLFDQFMEKYPKSRLMPNALYWKGENLYAQQKFADAIFMFKSVTATYPKHQKASDALLKVGMSYRALGDQDNATLHFRALYEDYPKSTAVQRAQKLGIKP